MTNPVVTPIFLYEEPFQPSANRGKRKLIDESKQANHLLQLDTRPTIHAVHHLENRQQITQLAHNTISLSQSPEQEVKERPTKVQKLPSSTDAVTKVVGLKDSLSEKIRIFNEIADNIILDPEGTNLRKIAALFDQIQNEAKQLSSLCQKERANSNFFFRTIMKCEDIIFGDMVNSTGNKGREVEFLLTSQQDEMQHKIDYIVDRQLRVLHLYNTSLVNPENIEACFSLCERLTPSNLEAKQEHLEWLIAQNQRQEELSLEQMQRLPLFQNFIKKFGLHVANITVPPQLAASILRAFILSKNRTLLFRQIEEILAKEQILEQATVLKGFFSNYARTLQLIEQGGQTSKQFIIKTLEDSMKCQKFKNPLFANIVWANLQKLQLLQRAEMGQIDEALVDFDPICVDLLASVRELINKDELERYYFYNLLTFLSKGEQVSAKGLAKLKESISKAENIAPLVTVFNEFIEEIDSNINALIKTAVKRPQNQLKTKSQKAQIENQIRLSEAACSVFAKSEGCDLRYANRFLPIIHNKTALILTEEPLLATSTKKK